MADGLELPRCRICGVPLMPETGVAFSAGSRVIVTTCQAHAQLVTDGAQLAVRLATKGLRLFLEEKAPELYGALQDVYTAHKRMKSPT